MTEMIDIVDENDKVIGKATWKEAQEKGLIFRSANSIVLNTKGQIFVHKRSKNLLTFPGMYDVKFGGIVNLGESYEEAAMRELKEEAGIKNPKLEFLFPLKFRMGRYKNNRKVFQCVYDGKLKLQKEEIEEGTFMTIRDIEKLMKEGKLSPSGESVYKEFLQWKNQKES